MRKVALCVAANVRLPRTSRGHPPRLVRAKQVTQETAEPCQFSPAERAAYGGVSHLRRNTLACASSLYFERSGAAQLVLGCLRVLKVVPVYSQLSNNRTHCPQLEIATTPIWDHCSLLAARIVPLAVRPSSLASKFMTAKSCQLASHFAILHGATTTVSSQTGPLASWI
jgi:hypothetical protein